MEGSGMIELTPKARSKFSVLQESMYGAQALVTSTLSRISLTDRALGNSPSGPNSADMEFELTRLRALLGKHQQSFEMQSTMVANIRRWIAEQKTNVVLVDWKAPKLKERSGESTADAVGRVRVEIATLSREQRDVRDAGLPRDELYAQCVKWTQMQASRCNPKITATHKDFRIEFGTQTSFTLPAPDIVSYFAWYDPETVIDLLKKEIDKMPVPALVMLPAERDARMTSIKEQLLRLERTEEQLIELAEQDDHIIPRRPLADPAALLGVVVERAAKAVA
jgi:hypothetical protein